MGEKPENPGEIADKFKNCRSKSFNILQEIHANNQKYLVNFCALRR